MNMATQSVARDDDDRIEKEIQARGLNAPRVTPALIESVIFGEVYFTADQGAHGAAVEDGLKSYFSPTSLACLTFCVLVLRNGFTVTGESACASPENFDAAIGQNLARAAAVNKIWALEGYLLKERLSGN